MRHTCSREEIDRIHTVLHEEIETRLAEFRQIWENGTERDIFIELVFCILTPQCKPQPCWETVKILLRKNLLFDGEEKEVAEELNGARFKYRKAAFLVEGRDHFPGIRSVIEEEDVGTVREWLVQNVKGIGYKEASHFLRNIGHGEEIAILDRHILRNLHALGVVEEMPRTLTKNRYLEIEGKMKTFADEIGIPMSHLDLVLWYKETGEIFK
jgi:N-glycosylase/DNA lyase